jgi:long-chain fatty acid transport protein
MTKFQWIKTRWAVFFLLLCVPVSVEAGGLYLYELGNPEVGLAGAGWTARAQDAATAFTNPAGMVRLDHSELMVGIQPLYLSAEFEPNADTTTTGGDGDASTWLPAGGAYYVHDMRPDLKLGLAVVGYFGLGLDYGDSWVGRYYLEEIKLQALSFQPSLGYRLNDWFSLGIGINMLYGIFEKKVAVNNIDPGLPDGKLEIKDEDLAVQFNLGILVEPLEGTRLGLTYLSEADLEFSDNANFSGLGPGLSTSLRNRGLLNAGIDLEMTMPQSIMFSVYHDLTDSWAVMGNLGWQEWSKFGMVGIGVDAANTTSLTVDRNYDDTWHTALGFQYQISEPWRLFAGVGYDSAMVDEKDLTPDLPMGEQWRFGLGAQHKWSKNLTIGGGYQLLWMGDLDMDLSRGPLPGRVSGTYKDAAMHFLNFNLIWKF